ncbi:hypothetical protein U9M48_043732 [Paspalum notatum var. saurae]|uniref:Uncharacterized protein n=1 Tax=Paspalum notatum var. saurae TaxID=547442 RepID=A0AAQ3UTP1_PASNO
MGPARRTHPPPRSDGQCPCDRAASGARHPPRPSVSPNTASPSRPPYGRPSPSPATDGAAPPCWPLPDATVFAGVRTLRPRAVATPPPLLQPPPCPAPAPSGQSHRPGATCATHPSWPRLERRPPATDPPTGQARRADGRAAASSKRTAAPTLPLYRRPLRHRAPGTVATPAAAPHAPPRPAAYKYPALQEQAPSPSPTPPHATLRRPKAAPEGDPDAVPEEPQKPEATIADQEPDEPSTDLHCDKDLDDGNSDDLFELLFG